MKEARIYLADEKKPAIVTAMHYNRDGLYFEQEDAIHAPDWRSAQTLATALVRALSRFSFRDQNLRDLKAGDWTAYQASRCRSKREFVSTYLRITVRAANEAELCYIAEARPVNEDDISLHTTIDRIIDEEMGRKLVRLYDVCSRWNTIAP